jgi:hypothetical protein
MRPDCLVAQCERLDIGCLDGDDVPGVFDYSLDLQVWRSHTGGSLPLEKRRWERVTSTGRNRCRCRFASVTNVRRRIGVHWLIIQNANGEGGKIVGLQVSVRIGD